MSTYVGNCNSIVNWKDFLFNLNKVTPAYIEARLIGSDFGSNEYPTYPGELEHDLMLVERFKKSNYNLDSACWHLYRPNEHFDENVANLIADYYKIKLGWFSLFQLDPGYTAPMHFEDGVEDADRERTSRIWIQLSPPEDGQVLTVGKEVFHNIDVGDGYRWDHYAQEHSAANCSMIPWYFIFLQGVRTDL